MKRILFTLTLVVAFIGAHSQCTPDPQYTIAGVYPDSATGLADALVGQAYSEVITIITPIDTNVVFSGFPITVNIIDIGLDSVNGLPSRFSYECSVPNCIFAGGSTACAVLLSASPTASEIGLHQLFMYTTTTVDAGLFGIQTQNDIIDYYYLNVTNATSTINKFDNFTFEMKDVFPNPVHNKSRIQFISGEPKPVVFSVFNYLGEKIDEQIIFANHGINDIFIDVSHFTTFVDRKCPFPYGNNKFEI